jgi:hypothetical protein
MSDDLDDMFANEGDCVSSALPQSSTLHNLRDARDLEDKQINALCYGTHQIQLQFEHTLLSSRMKSFELLRIQEECVRYHTSSCKSEVDEGRNLANALIAEYLADNQRAEHQSSKSTKSKQLTYSLIATVFSGQIAPPAPEATRRFVEHYFNEYQQMRQVTQNIYFPWQTFDRDVNKACVQLISHDKIEEFRAYMLGYIECIARLPYEQQTAQGQQCVKVAGAALGRHPFGSVFLKSVPFCQLS